MIFFVVTVSVFPGPHGISMMSGPKYTVHGAKPTSQCIAVCTKSGKGKLSRERALQVDFPVHSRVHKKEVLRAEISVRSQEQ